MSSLENVVESFNCQINRLQERYDALIITRNLLFAPISEEICFRALMVPFLISEFRGEASCHKYVILGCPLMFTLAHTHHLYERIR